MAADLGFKDVKLDISGFDTKPVEAEESKSEQRAADRAAERAGFKSREPVERVKRLPKSREPVDHAYVRGPVSLINRFKTYCNDEGLSYGEALDVLMRKAGI
jgi:hypothetical protein